MDSGVLTIIGVLIGGGFAILGSYISTNEQFLYQRKTALDNKKSDAYKNGIMLTIKMQTLIGKFNRETDNDKRTVIKDEIYEEYSKLKYWLLAISFYTKKPRKDSILEIYNLIKDSNVSMSSNFGFTELLLHQETFDDISAKLIEFAEKDLLI